MVTRRAGAYERLLDGWAGVFRHIILELMPVETISGHFDPVMGKPTKELYSMAGLLLIKEFMDWTKQDALDAYSFRMDIHYALNLEPITHDISMPTLERYINLFETDKLAKTIMSQVTVKLVDILEIKIDKQRLDSTHIFSDMASFGRTRLMEYPACCCLRENAPNRVRKGQCGCIFALFYTFDKENCRTNRPERSEKEFFGVPTAIYRVSTILCCGLKQLLTLASTPPFLSGQKRGLQPEY